MSEKMSDTEKSDLEASKPIADVSTLNVDHAIAEVEIAKVREIQHENKLIRMMRESEEWLDKKMGIELQGIDRIPEEQKQPPSILNVFLLWWSLNVHVGVVPLGLLGPLFGLTLGQSVGSAFLGICLGALCTAYTGTLGPKVRQIKQICAKKWHDRSALSPQIPYRVIIPYVN